MGIEILATVLGALTSLLAGALASSELIRKLVRYLRGVRETPPRSYSERLAELTASLTKASRDVDSVLGELGRVAKSREEAVQRLETDLASMEGREKELKEKIATLEQTPLPVAEHFAKLLEAGEKRSAKRDYLLFGAGVVVTTVIAIVIQLFAA